jgi:hypothetical protein
MRRGRRASIAAALAVAAAAAVTAGCGGGSTNALALDPVSAAATKTQAGAARVRLTMAVSGRGKVVRLHGIGAIDGTSAEMNFRLAPNSAIPQLAHASLREVALEQNGDYVIYLRLGFLSSQLPGGKQWIKLDVSKLGKSAGLDLGNVMSGSQLSPTELLGVLKSQGAKVQKLGAATVGGAATTHYLVTVDMAKALQAQGVASPLLSAIASQMKTLTENVWIGKDDLVRRVALAYRLPLGGSPRLAMTMDLYDYGAHVAIAVPPSSQVFDATPFAQKGLGSYLH